MCGMEQEKWRGNITPEIFQNVQWDLQPDLEMFMMEYMNRITSDFVKLSIGLRAPQIYDDVAPLIMKILQTFISSLTDYLVKMEQKGKVPHSDFECLAMTIFSSTFGYTFLSASFEQNLVKTDRDLFIKQTVTTFVNGILQK